MAELHYNDYPLNRDLFGVQPEEIKGRFKGWKENARYSIFVTVVLQIDTTNVSSEEYTVAPNLTFITTNQAIVNLYQTWSFTGSFEEFNTWYAQKEAALEKYTTDLLNRINAARQRAGLPGQWYVNYNLNDRDIEIHEASE